MAAFCRRSSRRGATLPAWGAWVDFFLRAVHDQANDAVERATALAKQNVEKLVAAGILDPLSDARNKVYMAREILALIE